MLNVSVTTIRTAISQIPSAICASKYQVFSLLKMRIGCMASTSLWNPCRINFPSRFKMDHQCLQSEVCDFAIMLSFVT